MLNFLCNLPYIDLFFTLPILDGVKEIQYYSSGQVQLEEVEKKKIRLELKTKTFEEKWQIVRWVTKFLEDNEKELEAMLCDLKESENQELRKWGKLKRFETS